MGSGFNTMLPLSTLCVVWSGKKNVLVEGVKITSIFFSTQFTKDVHDDVYVYI